MFDIITVGSATIDAFAHINKSFIKNKSYSFPLGSKSMLNGLEFFVGGGATNTAVSFARLGLKTACICKIGKGANSDFVLSELKKNRVNTEFIAREHTRTGFSVIMDSEHKDRAILVFKGSNNDLNERDIHFSKLKTKWIYLSSMMEQSIKTQQKIAKFAKQNEIKLCYNPSSYVIKKYPLIVNSILRNTDVLVLNKEEAQMLSKKKNMHDIINSLKEKGPWIAAVTDGSNAVYASDGYFNYKAKPHKITIAETTGAGDAFASTFLAFLIMHYDLALAIEAGILNSESVIQHVGAKTGLLRYNELMALTKRIHTKIEMSEIR